jgi:uncharacterized protein (TIGR02145 family)
MKKHILLFYFVLLFVGFNFRAQTFSLCPGDSFNLVITNYTGTLQWQESTDSLNWTNISSATYSPYLIIFSVSKYYRAAVTAPNCNPVYSPVQRSLVNIVCPYPASSIFCNGPTAIVDVINPTTGKTWMDRNLGASQVATNSTDSLSYGDLYQWGRGSDGHQCRNSATTSTLSSTDQPGNSSFILAPNIPYDWRSPQNSNLWQGVTGVNNPCPSGYRLPTETELTAEHTSWISQNDVGAFASPLKWSLAGIRISSVGAVIDVGIDGYYWSSTVSGNSSSMLGFNSINAYVNTGNRGDGMSVRCIKETVGTVGAINCGGATTNGNLFGGTAASGVTVTVPYAGGNGGYYA